jgi:hypothetical protein
MPPLHRTRYLNRTGSIRALVGLLAALGCCLGAAPGFSEPQPPAAAATPGGTALVPPLPPETPVSRSVILELGKRQISLLEGDRVRPSERPGLGVQWIGRP